MTSLTPEQQNSLQLFQEISQIPDVDLCQDILRENHWDVETAVESFVQGRRISRPDGVSPVRQRSTG